MEYSELIRHVEDRGCVVDFSDERTVIISCPITLQKCSVSIEDIYDELTILNICYTLRISEPSHLRDQLKEFEDVRQQIKITEGLPTNGD
ncbi:MAG: hypothetical protein IPN29_11575 [Saprospiraceae bacterium]|nr:hypothetical protein [Saprospiraceae bacterium]